MQAVKRALFVLLALVIASAAAGDERSEKRQLVSELLEVIDAKALMQTSFNGFLATIQLTFNESNTQSRPEAVPEDYPEEYRAQWEEMQRTEEKKMREFQERLFARVDYAKYFDEVYVPIFEKQFTTDELRHLIAFFKTRHGQKFARVLPELGIGPQGAQILTDAANSAEKEIEREEAAKHPWRATMSDMRSLATAVEARATDEGEYPKVSFEELEAVIAPTFIRVVPKVDSWGTPYLYVGTGEHYRFVSAGADKRFEWNARHLDLTITEPKLSESLDADIIFQDGTFIQSPAAANQ